jgi:hypothetical protein
MAIKKHKKILTVYRAYFEGDGQEICFLEKPNFKELLKAFKVDNSDGEVTGAAFTVKKLSVYTKRKLVINIHNLNHGN